jgi:2-phosphoglycerate kinase
MRSFIAPDISPALHRSSYASVGDDEGDANDSPIKSWRETCTVLQHSVETLVDEMIQRGVSLVVEGVHLVPNDDLIHKWEEAGGVALGILLTVSDEEAHKQLLLRRGSMTGKGEDAKLQEFERVRVIHDEMIRLAKDDAHRWMLIEQNLEPDPLEMVASQLWNGESVECYTTEPSTTTTKSSERPTGVLWEKPQREKNNQRPTKKKITEK